MSPLAITLLIAIPVLVVLFVIWAARFTKVGPNEVLIVFGRARTIVDAQGRKQTVGYRIERGGTFIRPVKERARHLSLELMTLDVRTPEVYTVAGVPVTVDAVAQVKIRGNQESIASAAEAFLSKPQEDIKKTALLTLEGHMRAVLGTLKVEEIYSDRQGLARRVIEAAIPDLAKMGLEIISLTIRNISDSQGYLEALGKPRIAQVRRDAMIGEAEAEQAARTFRFQAETRIDEARRDHEIKKAEYDVVVNQKKAESDLAYDLQKFKLAQHVKKEQLQVDIVEREQSIVLQDREVARREKELEASVRRAADAERYRVEILAEAEKKRLEAEAAGEAAAIRSKGLAQAEVLKAQGVAEAEAMREKAESWRLYNEAAVTEMVVGVLPKLAEAVAQPLSKLDKIVVISGGSDGGAGFSKVTRDIGQVIAQLPPVVEALTGVRLEDLLAKLPKTKSSGSEEAGTSVKGREHGKVQAQ